MTWKPHVTVAALVEREGRFLMVQERDSGRAVYNQPAGHLEDGESLLEAVIRETLEETAWHFQPQGISGIYRWRHPASHETYLRVAFAGAGLYHDPERELDPDIECTHWMSPSEIRNRVDRLRSPMVLCSLDDYLAGGAAPLTLLSNLE
jgi:8-oxo-dGTP pyrophosphatase MutT (NUDIX family)